MQRKKIRAWCPNCKVEREIIPPPEDHSPRPGRWPIGQPHNDLITAISHPRSWRCSVCGTRIEFAEEPERTCPKCGGHRVMDIGTKRIPYVRTYECLDCKHWYELESEIQQKGYTVEQVTRYLHHYQENGEKWWMQDNVEW